MNIDDLIDRIMQAAKQDSETVWSPVVSPEAILFVEEQLDIDMPDLLKRCYTEISNGGFGPGYQLTGIPGGHESSWGDLIQTTIELRRHEDCEDGWLPIIDCGDAQFTIVDCDDDNTIVTLYEGDFHYENDSLEAFFQNWLEENQSDSNAK